MYVCMYVCMYDYVCMYVCDVILFVRLFVLFVCFVCLFIYVFIIYNIYIYIYIYLFIYKRTIFHSYAKWYGFFRSQETDKSAAVVCASASDRVLMVMTMSDRSKSRRDSKISGAKSPSRRPKRFPKSSGKKKRLYRINLPRSKKKSKRHNHG